MNQYYAMEYFSNLRKNLALIPLFICILASGCGVYYTKSNPEYTQYPINSEIQSDEEFVDFILPYQQKFNDEMSRVIGSSALLISRDRNKPESLMGNFFTDALLYVGQKVDPEVDFSFATKDGMRTDLPKGDITIGHIFELMPFENQLVILELSANDVKRLAAFIAESDGQPQSGMQLIIKNKKITYLTINGQEIEEGKNYKLLTYDYIANGGDRVKGLENPIHRANLGQKVRESLIEYVSDQTMAGKQLNTKLDERIIIH